MAQEEEGWPFGLNLLNPRNVLVRNGEFSGSISFTTFFTSSSIRSTDSSSYFDTESTGSLFHDKSITLGSLLGVSSFLELSRRSIRGREMEPSKEDKKNHKLKPWLFSLCTKLTTDAVSPNNVPSLGQYLVAERRARRARRTYRRNQCASVDGHNVFSPVQESNSPFVGSQAARSSPVSSNEDNGRDANTALRQSNRYGTPTPFSSLWR
ncbi:uncharacterized protein LOC131601524 [Vicia villosa]|uniref:uncharacterized protein LOC131601524 n=1 Tax=Vicia villosa TaxID=3911 RepID=UPI00273C7C16|nr:uncharacterized protein LOC131601524 [Vicia villosa]